jgi:RNA-directed DNA polymerase
MAREMNEWLVKGIQTLIDGTYTPRFLKRYYFKDEMVDQLHLSDRILQHIILKQLKPTFAHVMHPRCYHLQGTSGVKVATRHIRQALEKEKPQYVIRADIKSFYKSIPHCQLIQDINSLYDDLKVQAILKELLWWFFNACWESNPAADFAAGLLHKAKASHPEQLGFLPVFESGYTDAL